MPRFNSHGINLRLKNIPVVQTNTAGNTHFKAVLVALSSLKSEFQNCYLLVCNAGSEIPFYDTIIPLDSFEIKSGLNWFCYGHVEPSSAERAKRSISSLEKSKPVCGNYATNGI